MQDILRRDRFLANTAFREGNVLGDRAVQVMTHHQHVQMLIQRVRRIGPRRISGARQHIRQPGHLNDVRRMPAAGTFGMERMDRAALERRDRVLDKAGLVQRVGMDHYLHVEPIRHRQAGVDRRRRRSPILMQLQTRRTRAQHFLQRPGLGRIALARERDIHRQPLGRLQHPREVPRTRRAGRRRCACRRSGAAANQGRHPGRDGIVHLLRADEMNMGIDPARRQDFPLAGNHLGPRTNDDIDAGLYIRIAGLADAGDPAIGNRHVRLNDPPMIDDQRIGNHRIHRALRPG